MKIQMYGTHDYRTVGINLIVIGLIVFLLAAALNSGDVTDYDSSSLAAVAFFIIMLGFALCFPSLLEESKGQLSTMRIIVFMVTMIFCIIYLKLSWRAASFSDFTIDDSWIYILGLAFGSKAIQRFGENGTKDGNTSDDDPAAEADQHASNAAKN